MRSASVSTAVEPVVEDEHTHILTRDDILAIDGHERVVLLAMCDGRWVPLEPDRTSKNHSFAGMVASGFVVRPATRLTKACSFRLELPVKGDVTRVFMRSSHMAPDPEAESPKYRECPFLLFVNDVLCVRHLPAHAITPSNRRARSSSSWEVLELRLPFTAGGGDRESPISGTRPARADTVLADTLEQVGASAAGPAVPSHARIRAARRTGASRHHRPASPVLRCIDCHRVSTVRQRRRAFSCTPARLAGACGTTAARATL